MGQSGQALRSKRDAHNSGDDVKRQVDSDVNHKRAIYQLVNVKTGGGKLIELIQSQAKHSLSSFSDSTVDDTIQQSASYSDRLNQPRSSRTSNRLPMPMATQCSVSSWLFGLSACVLAGCD